MGFVVLLVAMWIIALAFHKGFWSVLLSFALYIVGAILGGVLSRGSIAGAILGVIAGEVLSEKVLQRRS